MRGKRTIVTKTDTGLLLVTMDDESIDVSRKFVHWKVADTWGHAACENRVSPSLA